MILPGGDNVARIDRFLAEQYSSWLYRCFSLQTGLTPPMNEPMLSHLEAKLDQLIRECERLHEENKALQVSVDSARERESKWTKERSRLIEKNDLARTRVEAMITRLKSLEEQS